MAGPFYFEAGISKIKSVERRTKRFTQIAKRTESEGIRELKFELLKTMEGWREMNDDCRLRFEAEKESIYAGTGGELWLFEILPEGRGEFRAVDKGLFTSEPSLWAVDIAHHDMYRNDGKKSRRPKMSEYTRSIKFYHQCILIGKREEPREIFTVCGRYGMRTCSPEEKLRAFKRYEKDK